VVPCGVQYPEYMAPVVKRANGQNQILNIVMWKEKSTRIYY
jgi:hypothetical protein